MFIDFMIFSSFELGKNIRRFLKISPW